MSAEAAINAAMAALGVMLTSFLALLQTDSEITDRAVAIVLIGSAINFLQNYKAVSIRQFTSTQILNQPSDYVRISDLKKDDKQVTAMLAVIDEERI